MGGIRRCSKQEWPASWFRMSLCTNHQGWMEHKSTSLFEGCYEAIANLRLHYTGATLTRGNAHGRRCLPEVVLLQCFYVWMKSLLWRLLENKHGGRYMPPRVSNLFAKGLHKRYMISTGDDSHSWYLFRPSPSSNVARSPCWELPW